MPVGTKNQLAPGLGSHHIAIQTRDYEASKAFYIDVLGMRQTVEWDGGGRRICLLDIGDGSHLELFEPLPGGEPASDAKGNIVFHFALACTDIANTLQRVRAAGRKVTVELKDVQLGHLPVTIAFFEGPGGEVVELFQVNG